MGDKLTAREIEVVNGVRQGLSNKEIGKVLGVAPTTVKTHLENICRKLGVVNRTQIAQKGPELVMKPFAYFNKDTSALRFETVRDLRNSRIGEPREIPLYTADMVGAAEAAIKQSLGLPVEEKKDE
jgi:DNA-binding CsgD family transcriptional regulator